MRTRNKTKPGRAQKSAQRSVKLAATTALFTAGSLLAGCELPDQYKNGAGSSLPQGCYLEEFPRMTQTSQSLDLLFVADTSASLENKKARIAAGIDSFVANLSPSVDYQIAVMPAHGSRGLASGRLWKYRNNPYVLSSKAMSLSQIQKALYENLVEAPQDYYADGGEEGLYSLYHSMDQGKIDAIRAQGFYRPNAALAVVFISDENDICAVYPAGVKRVPDPEMLEEDAFKRDCAGVSPSSVYQRLVQMQNGRPLIVSGVVYNDLSTVPHTGGQDEYGYGYMDLIKLANGLSVDIAKGDFNEGLGQIGDFSAKKMQPTVDFKLAHSPVDPKSILVTLRNSSIHSSDDDDDDSSKGGSGGSCHCTHENGDNGSTRHCEAGDKSKFASSSSTKPNPKPSASPTPDGRVVDFDFDDQTNIVHLLDETAPEPLAEVQYCLKQVAPSPSPSVTPSPSPSPSASTTPTPSPTVTVTPSPSPTVAPSPSPSVTVTPTPSPSPSASPTVIPSPSPTVVPSPSPTVAPSPSPTVTVTPTPDPSPTVAPSPTPTVTATPTPDPSPSVVPSPSPTVVPSPSPTVTVTPTPDPSPTVTVTPTPDPSPSVTVTPSPSPTVTVTPSPSPTVDPSPSPSPTGCTGPFCGPGAGT